MLADINSLFKGFQSMQLDLHKGMVVLLSPQFVSDLFGVD